MYPTPESGAVIKGLHSEHLANHESIRPYFELYIKRKNHFPGWF